VQWLTGLDPGRGDYYRPSQVLCVGGIEAKITKRGVMDMIVTEGEEGKSSLMHCSLAPRWEFFPANERV
jgi:hypothetical protein